ncbi:MAG: hypothetical protein QOF40_167 [Actinomycetota bacterium]|jgi:hypothetical protein|nr:hypothetical protein [Actinomycetota bacterium]
MGRLRTILILRGLLALFFVGIGIVTLAGGSLVFGLFAIAIGITNAVLIAVLARRARNVG